MALLEKHPPHVRKKIAVLWTLGIAAVLVVVLILVYSKKKEDTPPAETSPLGDFYETISEETQSFFNEE